MELLYHLSGLLLGLIVGLSVGWLMARHKFTGGGAYLSAGEVQQRYVLQEVFDNLQMQADVSRDDLLDKEAELRQQAKELEAMELQILHLTEKLRDQKEEVNQQQKRFQGEFENIANKLLEEKSQKFTRQNQQQLQDILSPLKEKIKDFESGIERR